jgi:hypothetical protein
MKTLTTIALTMCAAISCTNSQELDQATKKIEQLVKQNKELQGRVDNLNFINTIPLSEIVLHTLQACNTKQSEAMINYYSEMIPRVLEKRIPNDRYGQMSLLSMFCKESGFNPQAQSPTGPKGLGQVAKAAFHEGLSRCGLPAAKDDDVWVPELNVTAAACYFQHLLTLAGPGRYTVAMAAYNQGPNSEAVKNLQKHGNLRGEEPTAYVSGVHNLIEKVKVSIAATK